MTNTNKAVKGKDSFWQKVLRALSWEADIYK